MSNQTHREPEDLARKRREYLKHKAAANFQRTFGIACTIAALFGGLYALWLLVPMSDAALQELLVRVVLFVAAVIFMWGVSQVDLADRKDRRFPYVPPVAEQIAALPADEILVRGSAQPASTAEELLRAAQRGTAEPVEELLKADDNMLEHSNIRSKKGPGNEDRCPPEENSAIRLF